ncbi:hypothetical protein GCM10020360_11420 [Nonlabens tegetincola]
MGSRCGRNVSLTSPRARLRSARAGWRYDPVRFPVTIDFNWTRAWHDPIVTHYDWIMLAVNVLLVGVVLTACLIGVISLMGRRAKRAGSQ